MKTPMIFLAALIPFLAAPAFAAQEVRLGETYLENRNDPDFIRVDSNEGCGVTKFKMVVKGDGAQINDLKVVFGNNEIQDIQVRDRFEAGSESQWKDLNGGSRCIKGIYVNGRSFRNRPRESKVVFVGLKQATDARPVLVGATALSNRPDGDFINLRQPVCGLTKFMVRVRNDGARIEYLSVIFGNGQSQQIQVREFFQRGSGSQWKDLDGSRRCIDKIVIFGQSATRPQQSVVEFWGLRQ
ncbi:MAG TPA: hypothetical protein VIH99_01185 [Bdellovibrionota bacterium]|jgi:hypothetical protein